MKINIIEKVNQNLEKDEINIYIEYYKKGSDIDKIKEYIQEFNEKDENIIVRNKKGELVSIFFNDIITFFSNNGRNRCRTSTETYIIKSKLYEIEKFKKKFIRISKSCIVNIDHVKSFNLGNIGKIVIKLDDNSTEIVSRRKVRDVLDYLDGRRI